MSLVSIVIPVYNVEKYIEKCVNSIINQTYSTLEIILVNDGSPDKSAQICERLALEDSRIKVIHKENGGLSDARNVGLKIANGDYICFVDSDDYVNDNMIKDSISSAQETNADCVMFSFYNETVDQNEKIVSQEPVIFDYNDPNSMIAVIGYAWNKLYKTSFLKKNDLSFTKGLSLVEDVVFNEKVFVLATNISYLNNPYYHYINRNRATLVKKYYSDSYKLHKIGFISRRNILQKIFSEYELNNLFAKIHVSGIKYSCTNMFYYKNNLSVREKYNNIKIMINDKLTLDLINDFSATSIEDRVFKFLISKKIPLLVLTAYYLKSIKIRL